MAFRQAAYRFFSDTGTESTSTALAALNTSISRQDGDESTFLIRFLIQADSGTVGTNTAIQFERNINAGAWGSITPSSTIVRAVTTSVFADQSSPTSQLGGSGTFETSSQSCSHDGATGGAQCDIVSNGRAETVCAVQIESDNVSTGDVVGIRISTTPTAITNYDQNATVTITAPPPAITSIDGDNDTVDTRTGVSIVGTNLGASETGSAKAEVSNNATYGSGTVIEIDATAWSATTVTVTLRRGERQRRADHAFQLAAQPGVPMGHRERRIAECHRFSVHASASGSNRESGRQHQCLAGRGHDLLDPGPGPEHGWNRRHHLPLELQPQFGGLYTGHHLDRGQGLRDSELCARR